MSFLIHRSRPICRLLIVAMLAWSLPVGPAHAALVTTEQMLEARQVETAREQLQTLVQREDVRAQLATMGVDPAEAEARIARLSDAEVAAVAGHLDQLPAGGSAVGAIVGAALLVFIILLITDLLGLTDFFPFVRN